MSKHHFLFLLLIGAFPQMHAQEIKTPASPENADAKQAEIIDFQSLGVKQFFDAQIKESIASWDQYLAQNPSEKPYHWQRGIALYYAERWHDGRLQFESHVKVNSQDVENSVWHFLCVAREESVDSARKALLPVTKDVRVPMREVLDLFAGKGSKESVVKAAEAVTSGEQQRRDALCFAHLYLGLYEEAMGHVDEAKRHLLLAAEDYSMTHYMGRVAQIHCRLRGWRTEPK